MYLMMNVTNDNHNDELHEIHVSKKLIMLVLLIFLFNFFLFNHVTSKYKFKFYSKLLSLFESQYLLIHNSFKILTNIINFNLSVFLFSKTSL
jgi:hypothetical protein